MLVYGYGNLSLRQSETDSLENLTLDCGWHMRGCSSSGAGRSAIICANRSVRCHWQSPIASAKPLGVGLFLWTASATKPLS